MTRTRASLTIDLSALERNFRALRGRLAAGVKVLCVVKADAYGHGMTEVSTRLEAAGADCFGVATVEEGVGLRRQGVTLPILVMGGLMPWEPLAPVLEHGLTLCISDGGMLEKVAVEAEGATQALRVHLKIDTGMGRLGFLPQDLPAIVEAFRQWPHLFLEGLMSHFAASEERDDYGLRQVETFRQAASLLKECGLEPSLLHMANSGATLRYPEAQFDMVRLGIMLYGSYPDPPLAGELPLEPVMRLTTRIGAVRELPAGSALSYGRTFVTTRHTRVGYIPFGYADGYPRALSGKGYVLIDGQPCPVVGRVCMDWTLVDVTDLPEVKAGGEVTLLGRDGANAITADELALRAGTIPYEILCNMPKGVTRIYAG